MSNDIEGIDYITCKICGSHFKQLNHRHLMTCHNISTKEYKSKYNVKSLTLKKYSKTREKTFLKKYGVVTNLRIPSVIEKSIATIKCKALLREQSGEKEKALKNYLKKKCWNYRNLRIITISENSKKRDKIDFGLIKQYNIEDLLPKTIFN